MWPVQCEKEWRNPGYQLEATTVTYSTVMTGATQSFVRGSLQVSKAQFKCQPFHVPT